MEIVDLVDAHFASLGSRDVLDLQDGYSRILKPSRIVALTNGGAWRHVNYFTFRALFRHIGEQIGCPVILETGSSAHGTNSSVLFASLAEKTGGTFDTVDLNPATVNRLKTDLAKRFGPSNRTRCHVGDSVEFISRFSGEPNVVYLDSFDLEPDRFGESAEHGLKEFEQLLPKLDRRALILIDDTPCSREIFRKMTSRKYLRAVDRHLCETGRLPGKGELVAKKIESDPCFRILAWEYQLLLQYRQ